MADDNADVARFLREERRAAQRDEAARDDVYARSLEEDAVGRGRRRRNVAPSSEELASSPGYVFGIIAFTLGMLCVVFGLFIWTQSTGSSAIFPGGTNCTAIQCTSIKGDKGDTGPPGKGEKGDKGDPGQCLSSPDCQKGDTGNDGADGANCYDGLYDVNGDGFINIEDCRGLNGTDATPCWITLGDRNMDGNLDIYDCMNNGTNCYDGLPDRNMDGVIDQYDCAVNGTNGAQGPQGDPGVCDCANIPSLELTNLEVNGTMTMSGTMTCPGGALDSSCFGLAVCPSFASCDLTAKSLLLDSGTPTSLQVGTAGDAGTSYFIAGDINAAAPTRILSYTRMYAQTARFDGVSSVGLTATAGSVTLIGTGGAGSNVNLQATGQITTTSDRGITIQNTLNDITISNSGNNIIIQDSGGTIQETSLTHTVTSPSYTLRESPGLFWLATKSAQTLTCAAGAPTTAGGRSIEVYADLVLQPGIRILSGETSAPNQGFVTVGGSGVNFCGGAVIKKSGGTVQLQTSTAGDTLDIQAKITNSEGTQGVTFSDAHGANFENTYLFNSLGNLLLSDNVDVQELLSVNNITDYGLGRVEIQTDLHVTGNVVIDGTLNGQPIDGTGNCCSASDLRVKQNVTIIDKKESVEKIMALKPKRWQYTPEFIATDARLQEDGIYEGLVAQDLESEIPQAVRRVTRKIGNTILNDLRVIEHHHYLAHLINSVQYLVEENQKLHERLRRLEK